jgi:hypothetical protein
MQTGMIKPCAMIQNGGIPLSGKQVDGLGAHTKEKKAVGIAPHGLLVSIPSSLRGTGGPAAIQGSLAPPLDCFVPPPARGSSQ